MATFTFWFFQIINGMTAAGMFIAPRRFHESMFKNPRKAYELLGFSSTAVEMLNNVMRGQAAALLAISSYLLVQGPTQASSFLLIALCCFFSLVSHIHTAIHHTRSATVKKAIESIRPLYFLIAINLLIASSAMVHYVMF